MKKKKEKKEKVFFPYLPSNRIEDNKRTKHIIDILEKNPFVFHKKKNIHLFQYSIQKIMK